MNKVASQNTSLTIVYSIVYSDADQRKHQSFASLASVWGIHRRPVNSPHKWPVTRKMFPFDDVIMSWQTCVYDSHKHHRIENCSIFIEYDINSISIGVWRWDNKKFIVLKPVIHTRQLNISSIPNAKYILRVILVKVHILRVILVNLIEYRILIRWWITITSIRSDGQCGGKTIISGILG